MRYSRTALKELKKRYMLILKKCLLLNMMLGVLTVSSGAVADETSTEGDGNATLEETESGEDTENESEGGEPDDPTLEEEIKNIESVTERQNLPSTVSLLYEDDVEFKGITGSEDGVALYGYGKVTFEKTASFIDNIGSVEKTGSSSAIIRGGAIYKIPYGATRATVFNGIAKFEGNELHATSVNGKSQALGGAIYNASTEYSGGLNFNADAVFDKNKAVAESKGSGSVLAYGGAIDTRRSMNFYEDVTFSNNTASAETIGTGTVGVQGGAIRNSSKLIFGDATEDKIQFTGNKAYGKTTYSGALTVHGGALYNTSTATFEGNASFEKNTVEAEKTSTGAITTQGGAVFNSSKFTANNGLTVSENTISSKTRETSDTTAQGGALYNSSSLTINSGATFKNNTITAETTGTGKITAQGGALYNYGTYSAANISGDTRFEGNTVTATRNYSGTDTTKDILAQGGAVFSSTTLNFKEGDVLFLSNKASQGGALFLSGGTTTFNDSVRFYNNEASQGGAIYNSGTVNLLSDFAFSGNKATEGKDIYNLKTLTISNGAGTVGSFDGGIHNASLITMNGAGTVIFGDEMENTTVGSATYKQTAGVAIANTKNFNLGMAQSITGGELRLHGNALSDLNTASKTTVSSNGVFKYYTTNAEKQTLELPTNLTLSKADITFGAYTKAIKDADIALLNGAKNDMGTSDSADDVLLSDKLFVENTIEKAKYDLTTDIATTTTADNVKFIDSIIYLSLVADAKTGVATYKGKYQTDATDTIDITGGIANKIVFSTLNAVDTSLVFDFDDLLTVTSNNNDTTAATFKIGALDFDKATFGQTYTILSGDAEFSEGKQATLSTKEVVNVNLTENKKGLTVTAGSLGDTIRYEGEALFSIANRGEADTATNTTKYTVSKNDLKSETDTSLGETGSGAKTIQGHKPSDTETQSVSSYVLDGAGYDLFTVGADDNLTVQNLTLQNANKIATVDGGTLTFKDVVLTNNTKNTSGNLIENKTGTLHFENASFTKNNVAVLVNNSGTVDFKGTTSFEENTGTALLNKGTATFNEDASFKSNIATTQGGAINNESTLSALKNTTFTENQGSDGGAIYNTGTLVLGGELPKEDTTVDTESTKADDDSAIETVETEENTTPSETYTALFEGNKATAAGGAIYNKGTATVLGDVSFKNNTALQGGAVKAVAGSTLTINGNAIFEGNTATAQGGALDVEGTVELGSGNTFKSNTAQIGGAVFVHNDTTFTSTSNTYESNTSTGVANGSNGGAIQNSGTLTSTGDTFTKNSSDNGGAIAQTETSYTSNNQTQTFPAGTMTIENGTFTENTATTAGGAIYNDGKATIKGTTTFNSNTATSQGGAINNIKELIIEGKNITFTGNTAGSGGAIANLTANASIKSDGVTFTENKATAGSGGAIYNGTGASYTANGDTFTGNSASVSGGAIYNEGTITFEAKANDQTSNDTGEDDKTETENTTTTETAIFEGNKASATAGAIYNKETILFNTDAKFSSNTVETTAFSAQGGAIDNEGAITFNKNAEFDGNKVSSGSRAYGGAIYNTGDIILNSSALFSNNELVTNNGVDQGGAIYNTGRLNINVAKEVHFLGNKATTGSAIYNTNTGEVTIKSAQDDLDIEYSGDASAKNRLFADGEDIYNAGTFNITNSVLQLYNTSDATKGFFNTSSSLTADAQRKVGTINIDNSRIDIGYSTLYGDTINFNDNAKLITHLNAENDSQFGKIKSNTLNVSSTGTDLAFIVKAGEHFTEGSRVYKILNSTAINSEVDTVFATLTNELYNIEYLGNGEYKLTYKANEPDSEEPDPDVPGSEEPDPDVPGSDKPSVTPPANIITGCEGPDCVYNTWIGGDVINSNDKAHKIQNIINEKVQLLGPNSAEFKKAIDGLTPDTSALVQSHSTEIINRLSKIVDKQLYDASVRSGYIHRGKRFYKFPQRKSNLWVKALYGRSEMGSEKGFEMDSRTLAFGFDAPIQSDAKFGVGYAYTTADGESIGRDTEIDSHSIFTYGEYHPNRTFVNWMALYSRSTYTEDKKVFSEQVGAEYDVDVFSAQIKAGRKIGPFVTDDWATGVFTPEIGLRYSYINRRKYEDDAGQSVDATNGHLLTGILGLQYSVVYALYPGVAFYPEFKIGATYDIVDPEFENKVTLLNGSSYQVTSEQIDRFGIEIGARMGLDLNRKTEVALEYEGLFKGDYTNHTGLATVKYKF